MKRRIIEIDQDKCVGCGLCANACQEGAIGMVDGKAQLLREDYCDGLGNCLPVCPTDAISFIERDVAAFDEAAVKRNQAQHRGPVRGGCPGSSAHSIRREERVRPAEAANAQPSELRQWPVQIKLAPTNAPYFNGAHLLIAADCAAYAYGNFHADYMRNKVTLIGCPKLDSVDYSEKLTSILANNDIKSLTVVRMEVPCCGGLEAAAVNALKNSGKFIPWQIVTLTTDGNILEN